MPQKKENVVTSAVVDVLEDLLPRQAGWEVEEQESVLDGNAKTPDIVVKRLRHETVGIDAKWQVGDGEKELQSVRDKYWGQPLISEFRGNSAELNTVMVIRYPECFRKMKRRELQDALPNAGNIEYVLVGQSKGTDYRFPRLGFATGNLRDVANAIRVGAVPSERIKAAAKQMKADVEGAARDLHNAVSQKSVIGEELKKILDQVEYSEQASQVACLIIVDAFVFQNSLAGELPVHEDKVGDAEGPSAQPCETEEPCKRSVRPPAYYQVNGINLKSVVADWDAILNVNYHPIFQGARDMLSRAFTYDAAMAKKVLGELCDIACTLIESHLPQIHELAGEVFQELLVDRKNVKANYTLSESAAFISALACPSLPEELTLETLPKVADYACGTGALLNGVYKRIQQLWEERKGETSVCIHQHMLENNLAGCDIFTHCTHLTFAAMASAHPQVTLGATRVITAPHGKVSETEFKTGSLELLDNQMLFDALDAFDKKASGAEDATAELKREFPDGEMDIVIMNPPFLTNSADTNAKNQKLVFGSQYRSKTEQELMLEELGKKKSRVGHGKVPYSYFVELADLKLRAGGRMAMILPASVFTIPSFKKVREMWATEYHNVTVVTIAQNSAHDSAFSSHTGMAEGIVIADKGVGENTGRAKFVSLSERPDSLLASQVLATEIGCKEVTRRLEDDALGGDLFKIGSASMASALDCPIDAGEWTVTRLKAMSLGQIAYQLSHGNLRLPGLVDALELPICPLSEVGKVGASDPDIKERSKRGAFEMHERESAVQEGYDAIYKSKNITPQRSMQTVPDYKAQIKPFNVEKAHRILREHNSRTHYHMGLGFSSGSIFAPYTESPTLGIRSITNVKLADRSYDAAWTLWTNSTFGLLCHWTTAGKQQKSRGSLRLTTLGNVPTLDVRELSDVQLAAAEHVFTELKTARMLPYNECRWDAWRHILDARLLLEVLGIDEPAVHEAMQTLREMLSAEPSITGDKQSVCDLTAEREEYGYPDDSAALATQQLNLQLRGIPLPDAAVEFEKSRAEAKKS